MKEEGRKKGGREGGREGEGRGKRKEKREKLKGQPVSQSIKFQLATSKTLQCSFLAARLFERVM